jgi:DNA-entry nuclease
MKKTLSSLLSLLLILVCLVGCVNFDGLVPRKTTPSTTTSGPLDAATLADIPPFAGYPYVVVYDNIPTFKESELTTESYEFFSELDSLGRCGYAEASIGRDLMPTDDREEIGSVTPSGWEGNNHRYDSDLVSGGYIYNRCHLIGFQLTGENANKKNLITGTRFFNVEGMLPFEDMIADYVRETDNHVLYRVTPLFYGSELVARGVTLEAYSVEDEGEGISEESASHIFDRFYQSDSSHKSEGNGLGLSLVSRILTIAGGEIDFENVDGGGARFTVTLGV